jgi:hypothetical protein
MIAKLSSYADQFDAKLIEAGKALFEKGAIENLTKVQANWHATVADSKKYKVTVNEEDGFATAVFCPCGPAMCRHVIGVFYALQKRLNIETEAFNPSSLAPKPAVLLGRRLNDLIYTSRAAGSKNGELEKQGKTVKLDDKPDMASLKYMVTKGLMWPHEKSQYPILMGAQGLLGKAIHKYAEKDYIYVFAIAKAVLTEICSGDDTIRYSYSGGECARAAVEILNTLCTDAEVPIELRKEVFSRVVFAYEKKLYEHYHKELYAIIINPRLAPELNELAPD